jgi:hypothetical protein
LVADYFEASLATMCAFFSHPASARDVQRVRAKEGQDAAEAIVNALSQMHHVWRTLTRKHFFWEQR